MTKFPKSCYNSVFKYSKVVILILLLLFLYSCGTKKVIKETTKIDTIYKSEVIKITPPQLNGIKIESVCDSLGRLKTFNYTFSNGKVKTVLKTIKDTLYLETNIDSIVDSKLKEYKSKFESNKKEIEVPYIPKWVWYSLALNLLLLIWLFRKPLIGFFKPF
jgi:hypothetical protein